MGFLTEHVAEVRRDLDARPLDEAMLLERARLQPTARNFVTALRSGAPAVIAEVKQASPSAGEIRATDPAAQARAYADAGAAAVSVLTEPKHFHGSLADLRAVRREVDVPVLRKDFVVHPSQLIESRAEGADAVLLIATSLSAAELAALLAVARDLGMEALVEAFGREDLDRAVASGAEVIGVNARDLETLDVDEHGALELLATIPEDRVAVFESGISTREQVRRATEAGASAVLVGTALMEADDPGEKLRELIGAGV
ncbi:MAG: indole-3-glycerol phosphate synthase TrpC [Actinomycetota bacterium]